MSITIPLNQLVASKENVRKTRSKESVVSLAANIVALGLLQNLIVVKQGDEYEVVAGESRRLALELLRSEGKITADYPVACEIRDRANATEISLAENAVRADMHPADEFDAFKKLADDGKSNDDIAARFGITPAVVKQRLKLASVSPKLMTEYREGKMDLEQIMAFTLTDDHKRQEKVWKELANWDRNERGIRRTLMQKHIDANDSRVKFIGLEAYTNAGGKVVQDLFDEKNAGYLSNPALVDKLVKEKLDTISDTMKAEGWSWVEIVATSIYDAQRGMTQIEPTLSTADQKERDQLSKRINKLADDEGDAAQAEHDQLNAQLDAIEERAAFSADQKAKAGVLIAVSDRGVTVELGMVKGKAQKPDAKTGAGKDGKAKKDGKPSLSAALVEALTAHRTAALRAELAANSTVALVAVVHALAMQTFNIGHSFNGDCGISLDHTRLDRYDEALKEPAAHKTWAAKLPKKPAELWDHLAKQKQPVLLDLLAYCVAYSLDAVAHSEKQGKPYADTLAKALKLDMTKYWEPTPDGYLARVSKAEALKAVTEACGKEAAAKIANLKRDPMAKEAAKLMKGKGWVPGILRGPK